MPNDYSKDLFQSFWGDEGYYEDFSYGIGIEGVYNTCLKPFLNKNQIALEIGSGGGVWTVKLCEGFKSVFAIDVVKKSSRLDSLNNLTYFELPNKNYECKSIKSESVDFVWSHNVFCHLSFEANVAYIDSICRVLKPEGNAVLMYSNWDVSNHYFPEEFLHKEDFLNLACSVCWFYQDSKIVSLITNHPKLEVKSTNMTPNHRDIVVHLKKVSK